MEKPNFERITKSFSEWRFLRDEIIIEELENDWERISKMESKYLEITLLEDLLKEYQLELLLSDFILIGFHFIKRMEIYIENKKPDNRPFPPVKYEAELFHTLDLLLNNNVDISIEIYKKQIHQMSIHDPILIRKIKEGLLEKLEAGYTGRYYSEYPLDIQADWGKYIKSRLLKIKKGSPKKGRPNNPKNLKSMVFSLWSYLQNNTGLKADAGTYYSNKQAKFIFRFFEIHKLINEPISNKADVIGYYIKNHIKSQQRWIKEIIDARPARIEEYRKQKIEIKEFLSKYEKDYRLTSKRKEDLQKEIKFLEEILERHNIQKITTK